MKAVNGPAGVEVPAPASGKNPLLLLMFPCLPNGGVEPLGNEEVRLTQLAHGAG